MKSTCVEWSKLQFLANSGSEFVNVEEFHTSEIGQNLIFLIVAEALISFLAEFDPTRILNYELFIFGAL